MGDAVHRGQLPRIGQRELGGRRHSTQNNQRTRDLGKEKSPLWTLTKKVLPKFINSKSTLRLSLLSCEMGIVMLLSQGDCEDSMEGGKVQNWRL